MGYPLRRLTIDRTPAVLEEAQLYRYPGEPGWWSCRGVLDGTPDHQGDRRSFALMLSDRFSSDVGERCREALTVFGTVDEAMAHRPTGDDGPVHAGTAGCEGSRATPATPTRSRGCGHGRPMRSRVTRGGRYGG